MAPHLSLDDVPNLRDKVVILTGGNAGIGFATAQLLLTKGVQTLIIASRSKSKVDEAVVSLKQQFPGSNVEGMQLDLNSLKSVKAFADAFLAKGLPLHLLINNAGVFCVPFDHTAEGMEVTIGVNHFATYYLTSLLLPLLKKSGPGARVIFVNSGAADNAPPNIDWSDLTGTKAKDSGLQQYNLSKLYNFMTAKALAKELQGSGVDMVVMNPGFVNTGIQSKSTGFLAAYLFRAAASLLGQSPATGAMHVMYALATPTEGGFASVTPTHASNMWGPTGPWVPRNPLAKDESACQRMYEETKKIIAANV